MAPKKQGTASPTVTAKPRSRCRLVRAGSEPCHRLAVTGSLLGDYSKGPGERNAASLDKLERGGKEVKPQGRRSGVRARRGPGRERRHIARASRLQRDAVSGLYQARADGVTHQARGFVDVQLRHDVRPVGIGS